MASIYQDFQPRIPKHLLCCSEADRNIFYRMSDIGFTIKQRKECWLAVTGAKQVDTRSMSNYDTVVCERIF